jgi:hypothetical protein
MESTVHEVQGFNSQIHLHRQVTFSSAHTLNNFSIPRREEDEMPSQPELNAAQQGLQWGLRQGVENKLKSAKKQQQFRQQKREAELKMSRAQFVNPLN